VNLTKNSNKAPKWLNKALEAMEIAFDENGLVKKNITGSDKKRAITFLKEVISVYKADEYWPYVKLADLIDDNDKKASLYYQSLKYSPNVYAYKFLYEKILKDNPNILDKYII